MHTPGIHTPRYIYIPPGIIKKKCLVTSMHKYSTLFYSSWFKLLMETIEQISIPLARVFNLSLKERVVPFEWKEANIIPLFKKGSRNKSENYRPVSLTSVICKLLERLIKDHMVDFLVKHKLLNSSQHGFLKVRSCLTNVMFFGRNH